MSDDHVTGTKMGLRVFWAPSTQNLSREDSKTPNELKNFHLFEYFKMSLYKDKV